jgi:hypothetical protein
MFEIGITKEDLVTESIANIWDTDVSIAQLVKYKAIELQQIFEELRLASNQATNSKIQKGPSLSPGFSTSKDQNSKPIPNISKNADLQMLSPRSSTSKKSVQKQPEIDSAKLDNFYIATIDD